MTTRDYEAMFLLDNNAATADYAAVSGQVDEILKKHDALIVQQEKWDERKLAYDIKGHRRGTYYLVYFRALPAAIAKIHEDIRLVETVLRYLILVLDEPIDVHVTKRAEEREKLAEDNRRHALGGWGDTRRKRDRRGRDGDGDDDMDLEDMDMDDVDSSSRYDDDSANDDAKDRVKASR